MTENSSTIFAQQKDQQDRQDEAVVQITFEHMLFVVAVSTILLVRLSNLDYNTLFLDEAINAVIGQDYLARVFERGAMSFHFGSYLYPALSSTLASLGGISALRIGAALTTTAAAIFIYLGTRLVFKERAALFAMILFGLSGPSISLGQLAVYDTLAIPFLALSMYLFIRAAWETERPLYYLLGSSAAMMGAVLAKYISLIYIPAALATGFIFFLIKGQTLKITIRTVTIYWLLPLGIVLGSYGIYHFNDLVNVIAQQIFTPATLTDIMVVIFQEISLIVILAVAGIVIQLIYLLRFSNDIPPILASHHQSLSHQGKTVFHFGIIMVLFGLVFLYLAGPIYHILGGNIRSLWKNVLYSLIFLAPLGGFFLAWVIRQGEKIHEPAARVVGLIVLLALSVLFVDHSLDLHESHQLGWPNVQNVMTYLEEAGLDRDSRVLAEAMDIYEYYFDFGTDDRLVWSSLWYTSFQEQVDIAEESENLKEIEIIELSIREQYYDFVILDGYYAPDNSQMISPMLAEAGYQVTFSEQQVLPDNSIILLQVFEPGRTR